MYPRVAPRNASRLFVIAIATAVLLVPFAPFIPRASTQTLNVRNERKGNPRPGKPEGTLRNLNELKEAQPEQELEPPIPSTIRSPKLPLVPWDGRTVGEEGLERKDKKEREGAPTEGVDQSRPNEEKRAVRGTVKRAHAARRASAPFVILDDTLIDNFYSVALPSYTPLSAEKPHWRDQLRVGYAKGQTSLNLAAVEMGKTIFESAKYLERNRTNAEYVSDLYWAYLMRAPDQSGWSFWTGVAASSWENARRAFEESSEFLTLMATVVPNGSASGAPISLITARVEPKNQPNGGVLTRDGTWSIPLITLPGRSGLDLGLSLSYSSQVWTKSGPFLYFDEDTGTPSPGFRLGFPTIQRRVFNSQTNTNSYLMVTGGGRRVELRQVGATNVYEAADSSYLQLTDTGGNLVLRSTDGTQLTYQAANNEYRCIEVKDRNGNYQTIAINPLGQITTITDTLGRVVTFNYDGNANLLTITQGWGGPVTHTWATFAWTTKTMQSSFSNVTVIGPKNGTNLPVLDKVTLNEGSYFQFSYSNSLQVTGIGKYHTADNPALLRAQTTLTYETPASDVPRLLDSRVSALNWTGINGVPAEVITQYSVAGDGACVMTAPDGTIYKEYYGTGYKKGLNVTSEIWSGGVKQKWTTTDWTQDDTSKSYELNPRVLETNTYDASGNRRRQAIEYHAQFGLPHVIADFAADGTNGLRFTVLDYKNDSAYLNRRIIGLLDWKHVFDGAWNLMSKTQYNYDWDSSGDMFQDTPAAATQHDRTNYGPGFIFGRGNLSQIARYDVTDPTNANGTAIETKWRVNSTGSVLLERDHLWHQKQIAYGDAFSDSVNRNTFAYPTVATDEDGNQSTAQYNFDFGAVTRTQEVTPAGQTQGLIQTMLHNSKGQLERVTTTNNSAYKRYLYGPDYAASYTTVNTVADEAYSVQYFDGVGRPILSGSNHPGSTGGYKAQQTIYDQLGRAIKVSNPAEVNSSWVPAGDDAAGWLYTQQTYNWQGKPLVTTNPDSTTSEASYAGCGCAGGEVVTLTDEGTINGGLAKRQQQKVYSDVLGRQVKTEVLNWQGGSVYATTVNTYNARDQITQIRQYAGAEGSGTYQDTTMTYDGHGRLKTKHVPEENNGTATTWNYNVDDTLSTVTDARGATTTFGYSGTNKGLVKSVVYTLSGSPTINIAYTYDGVGNRTSTTDPSGTVTNTYNQLSQLTSETRTFTGVSGSYALNYTYNLAGKLATLTIPFTSQQVGYTYNNAANMSSISGSGFTAWYYDQQLQTQTQSVTSFASNILYRAWGGRKSMTYGNTVTDAVSYNSRLSPTSYTVSNVNYYLPASPYTLNTSMTWTYDYYNDGTKSFVHHPTENKWDRSYEYDHGGRLIEARTNRLARGQTWDFWNPDPYQQTTTHDAFNHVTSRTGRLYWAEPSDTATYTNNRRSGWSYDAAGNVLNDGSYTHTYSAQGKDVQAISLASIGGGPNQLPYQPITEISQVYDANERPAKRDQMSRMPFFNENEELDSILENQQISYYVRSNALAGEVVLELEPDGQGGAVKKAVNVYGGGVRLARETDQNMWNTMNIMFEHQIPLIGSWLESLGHSGSRHTWRQERDPLNGEVPPSAGQPTFLSYPSTKWDQPMYIEGGDPYDYRGGCELDGMPIQCSSFNRLAAAGAVRSYQPDVWKRDPHGNLWHNTFPVVYHGVGIFTTDIYKTGDGDGISLQMHVIQVPANPSCMLNFVPNATKLGRQLEELHDGRHTISPVEEAGGSGGDVVMPDGLEGSKIDKWGYNETDPAKGYYIDIRLKNGMALRLKDLRSLAGGVTTRRIKGKTVEFWNGLEKGTSSTAGIPIGARDLLGTIFPNVRDKNGETRSYTGLHVTLIKKGRLKEYQNVLANGGKRMPLLLDPLGADSPVNCPQYKDKLYGEFVFPRP